jgi:hypothetical protein
MLETVETMSLRTMIEIVGPILLAAALVYATVRWLLRRGGRLDVVGDTAVRNPYGQAAKEEHGLVADAIAAAGPTAGKTPTADMPNPRTVGKLRSGRQDNRPSEDDIVRQHMGLRGLPGEPAPANTLRESETQISKALDPGHTA